MNPSVICHDVVAFYPVKYRKFRSVTVAFFFYFHSKVGKIILIGHCRDVECLLLLYVAQRKMNGKNSNLKSLFRDPIGTVSGS